MDGRRCVDFSAVKFDGEAALARLIPEWLRGRSRSVTTKRDIERWFFGTPPEFIDRALNAAISDGTVGVGERSAHNPRRSRVGYEYFAREPRK